MIAVAAGLVSPEASVLGLQMATCLPTTSPQGPSSVHVSLIVWVWRVAPMHFMDCYPAWPGGGFRWHSPPFRRPLFLTNTMNPPLDLCPPFLAVHVCSPASCPSLLFTCVSAGFCVPPSWLCGGLSSRTSRDHSQDNPHVSPCLASSAHDRRLVTFM